MNFKCYSDLCGKLPPITSNFAFTFSCRNAAAYTASAGWKNENYKTIKSPFYIGAKAELQIA